MVTRVPAQNSPNALLEEMSTRNSLTPIAPQRPDSSSPAPHTDPPPSSRLQTDQTPHRGESAYMPTVRDTLRTCVDGNKCPVCPGTSGRRAFWVMPFVLWGYGNMVCLIMGEGGLCARGRRKKVRVRLKEAAINVNECCAVGLIAVFAAAEHVRHDADFGSSERCNWTRRQGMVSA